MGLISFFILGIISGLFGKAFIPGEHKWGVFSTLVLGVLGVTFGGWLGNTFFNIQFDSAFAVQTWLFTIIGSVSLALIWRMVTARQ